MIRIITPKGELREVTRVSPVVEMRNRFNGKVSRIVEFAQSMRANPTALQVEYAASIPMRDDGPLFIGNLKPEAVRDIIYTLLSQGYYDFSMLDYQHKVDTDLEKTVFDNGESKPYTSEFCYGNGCIYGVSSMDNMSAFGSGSISGNVFGGCVVPCDCDRNTEYWTGEVETADFQSTHVNVE